MEQLGSRERASRFFGLMKERGELRRQLRVALDAAAEAERVRKGGSAHDLLALLRERRQKPSETLKAAMSADTSEKNRARGRLVEIDGEIKEIVADPDAHEAIHEERRALVSASREEKRVLSEWRDLHGVLDELDANDFSILQRRSFSAQERQTLLGNQAMREAVASRIRELRDAPETAVPTRLAELSELRRQLRDHKFAMTESRRELAAEIRRLWAKGEAVLLTGPTGTGKTELFSHLTRILYGRPLSRLIRATERTGPPEIFGKMGLRATTGGGTETFFQPGAYTDAIDSGMPFVIDEFNMLDTKIRFGLKELYNRGPGDEVVVQEDSGKPHKIKGGFVFGATANIKSAQSKERFELDPAESRVFASRRVGYLPKEELYDDILATLTNDKEELRLSRTDASETLKRLLEAVELTQQAFAGTQTQFYAEGGGAKKKHAVLEKAVIDPGRVLKVLSGWPVDDAKGALFRDFLERELAHIIRTEDYPEADRRLLLQIFVTKGFFRGWDAKEIGVPGADEAKLKAWGWSVVKSPAAATETLSREQVAMLDPFEMRQQRAAGAADEFLRQGQEGTARALAALNGLDPAKMPKSVQELLKGSESSLKEAVEVLGRESVFGPSAVEKTFGVRIEAKDIPPVPFSRAELERAKELGQFLILRVGHAADGTPLTMQKMNELVSPRFATENKGKVFLDNMGWNYQSEAFFTSEPPQLRWALVGSEVLPGSTSKNYLEQTEMIVETIRTMVFPNNQIPKEYADAIDEFESKKAGIAPIISSDWKQAAETLAGLKISELMRQTPAEALYDTLVRFDNTGVRHLPNHRAWTNRRASVGGLVGVGGAGAGGAGVNGWFPGGRDAGLGVPLAR